MKETYGSQTGLVCPIVLNVSYVTNRSTVGVRSNSMKVIDPRSHGKR
jgi:hypothetical protein